MTVGPHDTRLCLHDSGVTSADVRDYKGLGVDELKAVAVALAMTAVPQDVIRAVEEAAVEAERALPG